MLVAALGAPGDDAEAGAGLGLARGDDGATRGKGIAGVDRLVKGEVIDAEEWAAGFAEVSTERPTTVQSTSIGFTTAQGWPSERRTRR